MKSPFAQAPGRWIRFWRWAFDLAAAMELTEGEFIELEMAGRLGVIEERLRKLEGEARRAKT